MEHKKYLNNNNSENVIRNTYNYRRNGKITLCQNYFLYKLKKLYYKLQSHSTILFASRTKSSDEIKGETKEEI
jgi:hypothetical protein